MICPTGVLRLCHDRQRQLSTVTNRDGIRGLVSWARDADIGLIGVSVGKGCSLLYPEAVAYRKSRDRIRRIQTVCDPGGRVEGTWRKVSDQRSWFTGTTRC